MTRTERQIFTHELIDVLTARKDITKFLDNKEYLERLLEANKIIARELYQYSEDYEN